MTADPHAFAQAERQAFYKTIFNRRDVRGQFLPDDVPADVLSRVLMAAHYAPSVGFMQPWNFVVVQTQEKKQQVHGLFQKAHAEAAEMFDEERRETYRNLKLEGILESPINICVTCDKDRTGPVVVGRTHAPEMDSYSTVCAVQNLWLAARSEGLGFGWVSIMDHDKLRDVLNIPDRVVPVAYICLGYVSEFHDQPELQKAGWRKRLPVEDVVNFDAFGQASDDTYATELLRQMKARQQQLESSGFGPEFLAD